MLHLQHMDQSTSILDDKKYSKQFIDTIHFILINLELRIMQYATSTTGFLFNSFLDKRSSCSLAFLFFYFQLLGRNWLNLKGQFDGEGQVFLGGLFLVSSSENNSIFYQNSLPILLFVKYGTFFSLVKKIAHTYSREKQRQYLCFVL